MRLLLDTHIYLWWITANPKLTKKSRALISEADEVYISSISIWEAAIKIHLGKLKADLTQLTEAISGSGFQELPLTTHHVMKLSHLPPIHRDPFDRMLIAQAMSEPLKFLTLDSTLKEYSELVEII